MGSGTLGVRCPVRTLRSYQRPSLHRFRGRALLADAHQEEADFRWVLSIDGSSNQQGSGAGVILEGPNGLLIEQALRFAFKASNNQAEYEALIVGMLLAKEIGAQSLLAKSDSLLVTS